MANQEHLDILARGVEAWNAWRKGPGFRVPVDLNDANLRDAELCGADLMNTDLMNADLSGVDLSRANLGRADVLNADLIGANLSGADLHAADLGCANLTSAALSGAELTGADLFYANLGGADLRHANLRYANLRYAKLIDANLDEADLTSAGLTGANLGGANLSGAMAGYTIFCDLDLSAVRGLDTIEHLGPSSIGLDTIYRSQGKIPDSFLRGCGVPENFITYMHSLTGAAFDFYSCFISYSSDDQVFAERLHADLQARGVRCWFAPHDIQGGRKVHEQIDEAIKVYDKLLLILSDASMNSEWVGTEISKARKRERHENRRMLFPISLVPFGTIRDWERFDADAGKDSAREIREYYIPDFSNWKSHDPYSTAFERLLRDLKAEPGDNAVAQPGS